MTEYKLTKKDEQVLLEQLSKWKNTLNWKVAPVCLGLLLSIIVSPDAALAVCLLGLIAISGAFLVAKEQFPLVLTELSGKKVLTFREEILKLGITSYFFGFPRVFKHFGFYLSSGFVLSLALVWGLTYGF